MINCLAIEDEPLALRQLVTFIGKVPYLRLVAACPSAIEARVVLEREVVDAIFCDINMPDLNGMDFIKSLACPPLAVFTTAYSEYAVEGYKVDAVDYLLKPFGLDEFRRAAEKLRRRMGETAVSDSEPIPVPAIVETTATKMTASTDSLFVKVENRMVKVTLSDISYIEGMSEYLKIHFYAKSGEPERKPIISLYSLKRLEERLPDYFMRIHRSYIINLKRIQEVSKTRVTLEDDVMLPIGDLYKDAFNDYLNRNYIGK